MQLMLDTLNETPAALRLAASFLNSHASLLEMSETAGNGDFNIADLQRARQDIPPVAPAAPPIGEAPLASPAPLAAGLGAPGASAPLARAVMVPPAAPPVASNVVALPVGASMIPPAGAAATPDEFDSSGIPFDGRIHQKSRNKKKDGTWKIQKGLEDAVVQAVMRELSPRIQHTPAVSLPQTGVDTSGAVAPVAQPTSAPPAPTMVDPALLFGRTPLPAGAPAPVPLPQVQVAPAATVPPAPQGQSQTPPAPQGQADPFRALIAKITAARTQGKLSGEEVNKAIADAGAPSIQLLNNMPHLIPLVDSNIDALLITR